MINTSMQMNIGQGAQMVPLSCGELRVAGILDELSEKFFPYECTFINLDAREWENQIESFKPHLLFVESVWNGFNRTWRGKLTPQVSLDFVRLMSWCKERGIPTVFWNKEDPIHMFTFLEVAFHFDYVFTTDMDCVPLYKRLLKHDRVGVLPFATCAQLFNPIETYERKEAACFAGSYYAKREERRQDFERIAKSIIDNYDLDIYDRNPYPGNPDYTFPERFQKHILGTLPVEEIDLAYKGYKLAITLNIVKHSSTMEARRVFELLSCNTLTVSNPCLGIKNLFGDLVLFYEQEHKFIEQIKRVINDKDTYDKLRLQALRKVLSEHTYQERLDHIYRKVFKTEPDDRSPSITVFSLVESLDEINLIKEAFERQRYRKKQLFIFAKEPGDFSELPDCKVYSIGDFHTLLTDQSEYYAYISPRNYYGSNYLFDMALAVKYVTVSAIGKSAYYTYANDQFEFRSELGSYQLIDCLKYDRAIFASHLLPYVDIDHISDDLWLENIPCLSVDPYNFCENYQGSCCEKVDDIPVDCGISMQDLYTISDHLKPSYNNYSLGHVIKGSEIYDYASTKSRYFRTVRMPQDAFCFYTFGDENDVSTVEIEKEIHLEDLAFVDELSGKRIIRVYINGYIEGNVDARILYYSDTNQYLGGYGIKNQACVTIPALDMAAYFKICFIARGKSNGIIKEVIVNPKIERPIELEKEKWNGG